MRRLAIFLLVSAALNLVLAALLFFPNHGAPPVAAETNAPPELTNAARPRPQVVVRRQFFSWEELESPDYQVFITRLREIGCPEQTIRDIIIADVNQLYARRRLDEVPGPAQEWWRSTPDTNFLAAAAAREQALDEERRALLTRLLGPDWASRGVPRNVVELNGPVLGDLSPETKQSVQDIVARATKRARDYSASLNGKPADRAETARIEQQMRTELAKVLTPAQLEEFLLRYSASADSLRSQLRGFAVSPDDFRKLFRATDPIAQQILLTSGDDDAAAASRAALEKQLSDAIKNALGPGRYQALQLAQDPAYVNAMAVAQQTGAATNLVPALYRVSQAMLQEQNRIRNDSNLTPDQKAEQLKNLEQQQQSLTDQILGLTPPENPPTPATPPTPPVPATPPVVQVHPYSPGETIDQIAAMYGVSTADLMSANPNLDPNHMLRGAPINIPGHR